LLATVVGPGCGSHQGRPGCTPGRDAGDPGVGTDQGRPDASEIDARDQLRVAKGWPRP